MSQYQQDYIPSSLITSGYIATVHSHPSVHELGVNEKERESNCTKSVSMKTKAWPSSRIFFSSNETVHYYKRLHVRAPRHHRSFLLFGLVAFGRQHQRFIDSARSSVFRLFGFGDICKNTQRPVQFSHITNWAAAQSMVKIVCCMIIKRKTFFRLWNQKKNAHKFQQNNKPVQLQEIISSWKKRAINKRERSDSQKCQCTFFSIFFALEM